MCRVCTGECRSIQQREEEFLRYHNQSDRDGAVFARPRRIAMRAPREILARCLRMQTAGCFKSSANDVRVKAAAQAA